MSAAPSAAFELLHAAYRAREDGWRSARAPGQKLVGYVGNTLPVEAIAASGALPWRVAPIEGETTLADAHVESFSDLDMRLVFQRYVEGGLDDFDALIVPRSSENWHKLYLALREAQRTGLKPPGGPVLVLYDILHTQREASRAYGLARTRELVERLLRLTGQAVGSDAMAHAIDVGNTRRRLLAELQRRRRDGRIGGWAAQVATGAMAFMAPVTGAAALGQWLAETASAEPIAAGPRLLVKGAPLDHDRLHAIVESLGATIVAEDDDWGSRAALPAVARTADPLEGLFEHCWRERPCPRVFPADERWFDSVLAAGGIDGVLFNHPRPDDTQGWSLPALRVRVEAAGVPWIVLRDDARTQDGGPVRAALAPFITTLARRD